MKTSIAVVVILVAVASGIWLESAFKLTEGIASPSGRVEQVKTNTSSVTVPPTTATQSAVAASESANLTTSESVANNEDRSTTGGDSTARSTVNQANTDRASDKSQTDRSQTNAPWLSNVQAQTFALAMTPEFFGKSKTYRSGVHGKSM